MTLKCKVCVFILYCNYSIPIFVNNVGINDKFIFERKSFIWRAYTVIFERIFLKISIDFKLQVTDNMKICSEIWGNNKNCNAHCICKWDII